MFTFVKVTGIAMIILNSSFSLAQGNNSGGGWPRENCGPVVTEATAKASCDAKFPLPNPDPIGGTDQANNCGALMNRCNCYTPEYYSKLFERIRCVCNRSAADTYDRCFSRRPNHVDTATQCSREAMEDFNRCTSGATTAAAGAAIATWLDAGQCIAKFPFCKIGILPGPVKPKLPPL